MSCPYPETTTTQMVCHNTVDGHNEIDEEEEEPIQWVPRMQADRTRPQAAKPFTTDSLVGKKRGRKPKTPIVDLRCPTLVRPSRPHLSPQAKAMVVGWERTHEMVCPYRQKAGWGGGEPSNCPSKLRRIQRQLNDSGMTLPGRARIGDWKESTSIGSTHDGTSGLPLDGIRGIPHTAEKRAAVKLADIAAAQGNKRTYRRSLFARKGDKERLDYGRATLLEIHQQIINKALREISRPWAEPFGDVGLSPNGALNYNYKDGNIKLCMGRVSAQERSEMGRELSICGNKYDRCQQASTEKGSFKVSCILNRDQNRLPRLRTGGLGRRRHKTTSSYRTNPQEGSGQTIHTQGNYQDSGMLNATSVKTPSHLTKESSSVDAGNHIIGKEQGIHEKVSGRGPGDGNIERCSRHCADLPILDKTGQNPVEVENHLINEAANDCIQACASLVDGKLEPTLPEENWGLKDDQEGSKGGPCLFEMNTCTGDKHQNQQAAKPSHEQVETSEDDGPVLSKDEGVRGGNHICSLDLIEAHSVGNSQTHNSNSAWKVRSCGDRGWFFQSGVHGSFGNDKGNNDIQSSPLAAAMDSTELTLARNFSLSILGSGIDILMLNMPAMRNKPLPPMSTEVLTMGRQGSTSLNTAQLLAQQYLEAIITIVILQVSAKKLVLQLFVEATFAKATLQVLAKGTSTKGEAQQPMHILAGLTTPASMPSDLLNEYTDVQSSGSVVDNVLAVKKISMEAVQTWILQANTTIECMGEGGSATTKGTLNCTPIPTPPPLPPTMPVVYPRKKLPSVTTSTPCLEQVPDTSPPGHPPDLLVEVQALRGSLKRVLAPEKGANASREEELKLVEEQILAEKQERLHETQMLEALVEAEGLGQYPSGTFKKERVYGEGKHSVVYRAEQTGAFSLSTNPEKSLQGVDEKKGCFGACVVPQGAGAVAVKEFRYVRSEVPLAVLRELRKEAGMHIQLQGCERVVGLLGVWLFPRASLLLEAMEGGSLHRLINDPSGEWRKLGCSGAVQLLVHVAEGLAFLHREGVVHRDVKSHNIMVRKGWKQQEAGLESYPKLQWEAKVGDLGSAAFIPGDGEKLLTEEVGTSGWAAPEVFSGLGYGTPVDVFSLGVLCWEAFAVGLSNPLCGLSLESYTHTLQLGVRPRLPTTVPVAITDLITQCWSFSVEDRPNAAAVAAELSAIAKASEEPNPVVPKTY